MRTIVFTGGHVTPALAIIERLKSLEKPIEIVFIGRAYTSDPSVPSFEFQQVTARNISFIHLKTGRFGRHSIGGFLKGVYGLIQGVGSSIALLRRLRPSCVMTCGGYIGLSVSCAAYVLRIPVIMHEQTICPGLANRIIGRFAHRVFISFPQTASYFPFAITTWSGNPLRSTLFTKNPPRFLKRSSALPLLYITGGSLGAHSINILIEPILPSLLEQFEVVMQTGNVAEYGDFDRLTELKKKLSSERSSRLHLEKHVDDLQAAYLFQNAKLVISRSGANTITELLAFHLPSILIPLPWAGYDEQRKHARFMQSHHHAYLFEQTGTPADLMRVVERLMQEYDRYKQSFDATHETPFNQSAADIIVRALAP